MIVDLWADLGKLWPLVAAFVTGVVGYVRMQMRLSKVIETQTEIKRDMGAMEASMNLRHAAAESRLSEAEIAQARIAEQWTSLREWLARVEKTQDAMDQKLDRLIERDKR
ncbi:hypothetical protein [Thauera sp.]|uniref:hypothetical protein n=1 Tax=Thauera sp. TaxID=1905334 RepID=UPI002BEF410D|nr:hypothetical protein [Thauera sp.]HRP26353.1 hypothetical protein [Thauera sp.]